MEKRPTFGAMLVTAPAPHVVLYEMSVRVPRAELVPVPGYALYPWLTIRVDTATQDYAIGAGVKAKRVK